MERCDMNKSFSRGFFSGYVSLALIGWSFQHLFFFYFHFALSGAMRIAKIDNNKIAHMLNAHVQPFLHPWKLNALFVPDFQNHSSQICSRPNVLDMVLKQRTQVVNSTDEPIVDSFDFRHCLFEVVCTVHTTTITKTTTKRAFKLLGPIDKFHALI